MSTVNAGWRGPNIVKDGLVLYLDAASGTSYSPYNSGTTWRDISGNNNNGTLTNGPVYNTANGGSFVFDGVNDYVTLPNVGVSALPAFSVSFWASTITGASNPAVYVEGVPASWPSNLFIIYYGDTASNGQTIGGARVWFGTASRLQGTTDLRNAGWNFITYIQDNIASRRLYVNTTVQSTNTVSITSNATETSIGAGRQVGYQQFFNGNLAYLISYNRALSAEEVLQNYNATKGRFGL